jgi:ketosteroid isomerase-like protein
VKRFQPSRTVEITGAEAILNPDQSALDEARRKSDQAAWDGVNKNDRAALQQYIDQHPGGRFAQDASNFINRLEQAERQKRDDDQRGARLAEEQRKALEAQRKSAQEEEQRKKEAAGHQQQLEMQQRAAAEKQAVLDVLKKYEAAYKNRDASAVKAVFPDVPKFNTIVNSFRIFRSYDLTLEPAEPQITGDSAVVRCRRTIRVADEHGTQPPRSDAVTFRLQKTQDRWVIVSLQ